MEEDSLKPFISSVIFTAKLFNSIKDRFYLRKLYLKLNDFISAYIRAQENYDRNYVAQYQRKDFIKSTDTLLELLGDINYLHLSDVAPLLSAQRQIMVLKLSVLKIQNKNQEVKPEKRENRPIDKPTIAIPRKRTTSSRTNPNKEKILAFIRTSSPIRTKELIDKFNTMSDRTVKRNLKELLNEGLLVRQSENKAVYYSATD